MPSNAPSTGIFFIAFAILKTYLLNARKKADIVKNNKTKTTLLVNNFAKLPPNEFSIKELKATPIGVLYEV